MSLAGVRKLGVGKRAPKYMKRKLAEPKGDADGSVRAARDLSATLSVVGRTPRRMDGTSTRTAQTQATPACLQSAPPRSRRVDAPLTDTRDVLQGGPLARPQTQSQQTSKD